MRCTISSQCKRFGGEQKFDSVFVPPARDFDSKCTGGWETLVCESNCHRMVTVCRMQQRSSEKANSATRCSFSHRFDGEGGI